MHPWVTSGSLEIYGVQQMFRDREHYSGHEPKYMSKPVQGHFNGS